MSSFSDLGVPARLKDVLTGLSIETPTPIQQSTLPDALAGRDVLGRGRTGSGKTLAFLLPVVTRLTGGPRARSGAPRALILAPTRELVGQIDAALQPLARAAGLTSRTVFGGVGQNPQVAALRQGVDIVVACPGRLEDLMQQGHCSLSRVEITVLDEADHMADLGFLPAVRRILTRTPADGQRMLFSATLDRAIDGLVRQFLTKPAVHEADSAQSPVGTMSHHVLHVEREHRLPVLVDLTSAPGRTVVFTRTKHGAKALTRQLNRSGVPAVELHGNLSQNARTRNLDDFHAGRVAALVATDIAARGIHVDDVTLVIHADPPADPKAYLHRSGRTARAGNAGTVVTLMTSDQTREVRDLTRAAGIAPRTTRIASAEHPVLTELAPGPRVRTEPVAEAVGQPGRQPAREKGTDARPSAKPARSRDGHRPDRPATPRAGRRGRATTRSRANGAPADTGRTQTGRTQTGRTQTARTESARTERPRHSAAGFSSGRR